MTVAPPAGSGLERNAHAALAVGRRSTRYVEPVGASTGRHAAPTWKLVLGLAGPVEAASAGGRVRAAGVVVPPGLVHEASSVTGHVAVFVDPWHEGLGRGADVVPLDDAVVEALLAELLASGAADDLDVVVSDVVNRLRRRGVLPPAARLDDRLVRVLDTLDPSGPIAALATRAERSPGRLRAVAHRDLGLPLAQLRSWARLRRAVLQLDRLPPAEAAAAAGFADQAHLTRTAGRMLGRTPGSVAPALRGRGRAEVAPSARAASPSWRRRAQPSS